MRWFRKPQPVPEPKPKACIELCEYVDQESGAKHWDVFRECRSTTDDYGYKTLEEATKAYARMLAIERGELKVGLRRYTVEQTFVESNR